MTNLWFLCIFWPLPWDLLSPEGAFLQPGLAQMAQQNHADLMRFGIQWGCNGISPTFMGNHQEHHQETEPKHIERGQQWQFHDPEFFWGSCGTERTEKGLNWLNATVPPLSLVHHVDCCRWDSEHVKDGWWWISRIIILETRSAMKGNQHLPSGNQTWQVKIPQLYIYIYYNLYHFPNSNLSLKGDFPLPPLITGG